MITRIQAEALLKLAEALEECERKGLVLGADRHGAVVAYGDVELDARDITAMQLRVILDKLVPRNAS